MSFSVTVLQRFFFKPFFAADVNNRSTFFVGANDSVVEADFEHSNRLLFDHSRMKRTNDSNAWCLKLRRVRRMTVQLCFLFVTFCTFCLILGSSSVTGLARLVAKAYYCWRHRREQLQVCHLQSAAAGCRRRSTRVTNMIRQVAARTVLVNLGR